MAGNSNIESQKQLKRYLTRDLLIEFKTYRGGTRKMKSNKDCRIKSRKWKNLRKY